MSSAPKSPGAVRKLWYRWKSLRLPWRRQFLVGADLAGNTFWEFKDALQSNRFRRIVRYARAGHYADVKVSPQWHQWLRYTRPEPPSLQEQQYEVSRQAAMKQLAAKADERWKSVPSFLDSPTRQQPQPLMQPRDPGGCAPQTEPEQHEGVTSGVENQEKIHEVVEKGADVDEGRFKGGTSERKRDRSENPWQRAPRGAPSENWQPEAWSPGVAARR